METLDLETLDPCPEPTALFCYYNDVYFEGKLGACSVQWSSARMTLCGGVCEYRGGGCTIKLSAPLMKFRPVKELKEVLLHEMIHAWMFLLKIRDNERGGHGTKFQAKMAEINQATCTDLQRPPEGYHITVCHSMFAEVDHYRTHHWQCNTCQNVVKRAMNRPPQEADCRGRMGRGEECQDPKCNWHMHLKHCPGTFKKVKEPEEFTKKNAEKEARKAKRQKHGAGSSAACITSFLTGTSDRLGDGPDPTQPSGPPSEFRNAVLDQPSRPGQQGSKDAPAVPEADLKPQPVTGADDSKPSSRQQPETQSLRKEAGRDHEGLVDRGQLRQMMAQAAMARMQQQQHQAEHLQANAPGGAEADSTRLGHSRNEQPCRRPQLSSAADMHCPHHPNAPAAPHHFQLQGTDNLEGHGMLSTPNCISSAHSVGLAVSSHVHEPGKEHLSGSENDVIDLYPPPAPQHQPSMPGGKSQKALMGGSMAQDPVLHDRLKPAVQLSGSDGRVASPMLDSASSPMDVLDLTEGPAGTSHQHETNSKSVQAANLKERFHGRRRA
ncbi:hypothetical protein WJX84_007941 [Apatococcus fuscideae]|uniref:SprT-like domain-containing protein n=1 Tax=Apatococcus fuscideae TaxID=2026836 RepID=A0AAW1TFL9_9CHLO